ncbi:MAG: DUF2807 domain-containing protein [Pseudomonadota bacterium]
MARRSILLAAAMTALAGHAAAHDDPSHNQKTFEITPTTTVKMSGIDTITMRIGEEPSLMVEERRGRLKGLTVTSTAESLSITSEETSWFSSRDYIVTLTLPALSVVDISGSFDADIAGVNAKAFAIDLAGSGDLLISGRCEQLTLDSAGSMDVDAKALICQSVEIDSAGAADMHVYAAESLNVEGAGATDVLFSGNPGKVTSDVAGLGKVTAAPASQSGTTL